MTTYGKGTKRDRTRTKFPLWKLVVDRPRHSADGTFDATKTIVARVPTCELFAFLLTKADDYDCCLNMVFYVEDEGSVGMRTISPTQSNRGNGVGRRST